MKRYFNGRNVLTAVKALGVMLIIMLLVLFVGNAGLFDGTIGWVMFAGFLAIFLLSGFVDGLVKGQDEAKLAARLEHQREKTGKELDERELLSMYDRKKGLAVALMIAVPGLLLALLSLLTQDQNLPIRIVTRFYHTPYLRLIADVDGSLFNCLLYLLFSLPYPITYFGGYLYGHVAHGKMTAQLRKNEEDYKKGIRRRRPPSKKRRRGLFS